MAEIKRENIYRSLPFIYNHLMKRIRYDFWSDYLFQLTSKYVSTNASVLELAAGNCQLAKFMATKYPDLIVSDISNKMLESSYDLTLKKVCCDMSCLPFKRHFDMIYMTFDSINYLLSKKSTLAFLKNIKESLCDNGIFTFDASLERNSISHVSQPVRQAVYNGFSYVHKSSYNKKTRVHKNIFNITFPDGEIHKEIHKQKILEFYDYFDLIERAGLFVVECFDAFTFKTGRAKSKRVQFVIKKS